MTADSPQSIDTWRPPRPKRRPSPPRYLGPEAAKVWRDLVAEFDFDTYELSLLAGACALLQRADEARDDVARTKPYGMGVHGPRAHPGIDVENRSLLAAARLFRELRLTEPAADARRRLGGIA